MVIFFFHFLFAVLLFFIINWIGKHSYSIGYMAISIFAKNEEAPALNFLIRVLTPVIYIIIISASLYYLKLDGFVKNIYLINIYYILFRLVFNLTTNRGLLMNWYKQLLYWISIIIVSYLTYEKIIKIKANILPDFSSIANELWVIILIFLFQLANNIKTSNELSIKRKDNYLKARYKKFKLLYGNQIKNITNNEVLEAITFEILIYEDFNRPKAIRIVENLKQRFSKKPHTLGVMQVKSKKLLTDKESVVLGTKKIVEAHKKFLLVKANDQEGFHESYIFNYIISDYNEGESYNDEVTSLVQIILENFYKDTKDALQPLKAVPPEFAKGNPNIK